MSTLEVTLSSHNHIRHGVSSKNTHISENEVRGNVVSLKISESHIMGKADTLLGYTDALICNIKSLTDIIKTEEDAHISKNEVGSDIVSLKVSVVVTHGVHISDHEVRGNVVTKVSHTSHHHVRYGIMALEVSHSTHHGVGNGVVSLEHSHVTKYEVGSDIVALEVAHISENEVGSNIVSLEVAHISKNEVRDGVMSTLEVTLSSHNHIRHGVSSKNTHISENEVRGNVMALEILDFSAWHFNITLSVNADSSSLISGVSSLGVSCLGLVIGGSGISSFSLVVSGGGISSLSLVVSGSSLQDNEIVQ
jgi:hypothetical protein